MCSNARWKSGTSAAAAFGLPPLYAHATRYTYLQYICVRRMSGETASVY
jgi:hypothetical protein